MAEMTAQSDRDAFVSLMESLVTRFKKLNDRRVEFSLATRDDRLKKKYLRAYGDCGRLRTHVTNAIALLASPHDEKTHAELERIRHELGGLFSDHHADPSLYALDRQVTPVFDEYEAYLLGLDACLKDVQRWPTYRLSNGMESFVMRLRTYLAGGILEGIGQPGQPGQPGGRFKEALSLVYEIDTQNLDPLEYDCLLEATGFSSPIKSTSIHFFLKRAETIEERSNILYYRSQHEKDDATALTLLNDLISLNESYLQFSAYASKAYIYAKKTNEDLENKNLDSAQSNITNAVVEMDTFFNKNHLDPKQSNIDNWNDFFTFHYSQYQYLNLLKENIDREKEP